MKIVFYKLLYKIEGMFADSQRYILYIYNRYNSCNNNQRRTDNLYIYSFNKILTHTATTLHTRIEISSLKNIL